MQQTALVSILHTKRKALLIGQENLRKTYKSKQQSVKRSMKVILGMEWGKKRRRREKIRVGGHHEVM